MGIYFRTLWCRSLCTPVAGTQCPIDNNEHEYSAETAAAQFFRAIAGDKRSEEIIHK